MGSLFERLKLIKLLYNHIAQWRNRVPVAGQAQVHLSPWQLRGTILEKSKVGSWIFAVSSIWLMSASSTTASRVKNHRSLPKKPQPQTIEKVSKSVSTTLQLEWVGCGPPKWTKQCPVESGQYPSPIVSAPVRSPKLESQDVFQTVKCPSDWRWVY